MPFYRLDCFFVFLIVIYFLSRARSKIATLIIKRVLEEIDNKKLVENETAPAEKKEEKSDKTQHNTFIECFKYILTNFIMIPILGLAVLALIYAGEKYITIVSLYLFTIFVAITIILFCIHFLNLKKIYPSVSSIFRYNKTLIISFLCYILIAVSFPFIRYEYPSVVVLIVFGVIVPISTFFAINFGLIYKYGVTDNYDETLNEIKASFSKSEQNTIDAILNRYFLNLFACKYKEALSEAVFYAKSEELNQTNKAFLLTLPLIKLGEYDLAKELIPILDSHSDYYLNDVVKIYAGEHDDLLKTSSDEAPFVDPLNGTPRFLFIKSSGYNLPLSRLIKTLLKKRRLAYFAWAYAIKGDFANSDKVFNEAKLKDNLIFHKRFLEEIENNINLLKNK